MTDRMSTSELADLLGGTGGITDEITPPLKQRQMPEVTDMMGLEREIRDVMNEQSLTIEEFREKYCVQYTTGDIEGRVVKKPVGPFDAEVDDLPRCVGCGIEIRGVGTSYEDGTVWHCRSYPACQGKGQGELGI